MISKKGRFQGLKSAFSLLDARDQKKLTLVTLLQIFSAGLDLLGVAAIGLLGAMAVNGVSSQNSSPRIRSIVNFLHLSSMGFQTQIAVVGLLATTLLISKTIFSVFFTRFYLFFLSNRSAQITIGLVKNLMTRQVSVIKGKSSQSILFGLSAGVNAITMGVIASCIMMASDLALLIVMIIALVFVDVVIALSTIILFGLIGITLYWLMQSRARKLGSLDASLAIRNNNVVLEILGSLREILVRNRQSYYEAQISDVQNSITRTRAELTFLPNVSKYVVETSVVLGALTISAIQFSLHDASHSVATLAVFMAAGSRIAPAVLRLQQGAIAMRSNLAVAGITLNLVKDLNSEQQISSVFQHLQNTDRFLPGVELSSISYRYPNSEALAIKNVSLNISAGSQVAIVGGSGAGKSTLVDILLGLLVPQEGGVLISGLDPSSAIQKWPGKIGYLPQHPYIADSSIRSNICLGFDEDSFSENDYERALDLASLSDFVSSLSLGLDSPVGEGGSLLSGGQKQRLGLARALISQPELLILDEVTSALDAETEHEITSAIASLRGRTTVIVIAHQLRTIKNADLVIFLERGEISGIGNFENLTKSNLRFQEIVKLNRL